MDKIWLQSYPVGVPPTVDFENITLPEALERAARQYPKKPALNFQGAVVTFEEFDRMVSRFAAGLVSMGLKRGDRVALLLPNLVQAAVGIYGALRAGGTAVPMNPLYSDVEFRRMFTEADARFLVCLDTLVPRMIKVRDRTEIGPIVSCHIRDYLPAFLKKVFPILKRDLHLDTPEGRNIHEFTDIVAGTPRSADFAGSSPDDTAMVLFTTGTVGLPKGVELTHRNLACNCRQAQVWASNLRAGEEVILGCLPFFHSYGLTIGLNLSVLFGWENVLMPKPDAGEAMSLIQKYRVTVMAGVPPLFNAMINHPKAKKFDLSSVRTWISGAWPMALETIEGFKSLTGAEIAEGYGLTEASPLCACNPVKGLKKPGSTGLPLPSTEAKLVDLDDPDVEITEPGVPGEVCFKGPQIMKGYVGRPDDTAAVIRDGWLLTGDVATFDESGYLFVVDRKKDIVKTDQGYVFPREIDEALYAHPKILEGCALGVPDRAGGERIKAFVVLKRKQKADAKEIIDYCRRLLEPHKVPQEVEFIDELPKSIIGKILRKELRRKESAKLGVLKQSV